MILVSLLSHFSPIQSNSFAIAHVSVIPMDRETTIPDQTVLVRGSKIVALGSSGQIKIPPGSTVINGKGKFLLPGLIDMDVQIRSAKELPLYLANGVTTVLNNDGRPAHIAWRNKIKSGSLKGPNIFTCGPRIGRSKDAAEATQMVETQFKAGYDSIFVNMGVNAVSYPVLISTAKKFGLQVFGSIPRNSGLEGVLKAKMPIMHTEEFFNTYLRGSAELNSGIQRAAELTAGAKVPVIAGLVSTTHNFRQADDLQGFLSRTQTQFLSPWQRSSWQPGNNSVQNIYRERRFIPAMQGSLENEKEMIRRLNRIGGTVLVGTNANSTGVVPGFGVIEEISNFRRLGFTNFQAIRAATTYSANALGQSANLGSISVGKRADMILLDGNPLSDLGNLNRRSGVFSQGRWLPSSTLQQDLNSILSQYANLLSLGLKSIKSSPNALEQFQAENDPFRTMTQPLMFELVKLDGESGYARFVSQMAAKEPKNPAFNESGINLFGYWLMTNQKQIGLAIKVFSVNVRRYPKSANVYDSLAEGYLNLGNKAKAIEFYRKAIKVDPAFPSSMAALKKLGAR